MKKIYLTLIALLAVVVIKASPDIYTPELVAPSDNATGIFPNVELDWTAVTGELGLYYELQLDTDANFTNPVVFTTEYSSKVMSMLHFGTQYFWKVRAIDNSATSEWSTVRSFTVISTVTIRRPTADATNVAPNVQIMWESLPGATFIDYQLDTTTNFNSPLMTVTSVPNTTVTTNASNLYFGLVYKIRLRARHDLDTSDWSAPRSFTVVNSINLKQPDPGITGIFPDAEFQWSTIQGLTKWQIHLSNTAEMAQYDAYNVLKTATKFIPDTLMFNTTYYWRMAAIHELDTLYSEVLSFTTVDKPSLLTPANNATNVELQPTLTWDEITGLLGYQVDIANNAQFDNHFSYFVNDGGTVTEFKVPVHVLDSATVYYWRVRAISSRDTSEFSEPFSFRSVTLGNEEAIALKTGISIYPSPAVNKVNLKLRNTFNGRALVEVYDLLGNRKMRSSAQFNAGLSKDFMVNDLSNGIYMVSIILNDQRYTTKLIIQK